MPKSTPKRRNAAAHNNPYAHSGAKSKATNNIFKMNTDLGQHVLKNPGVAEAIVNKADLKQSDVSQYVSTNTPQHSLIPCRLSSKSAPEQAI